MTNRQDSTNIDEKQQAVRDSEARLRAIIETVQDGIITINDQGIIETVNPAALTMFGYQATELTGKNVKILMPKPYHDEHDGYLSHYHDTGVKRVIGIGREVTAKRKDGSTFPIELEVSEMEVAGSKMYTGVIKDISSETIANARRDDIEARNQAILHTIVDGIITISKHGIIETVNPAAERLFGYSAHEVIGKNVKMLMPSPYREGHDGYLEKYLQTGEKHIIGVGREVVGQRKDGSTFPMDLAVSDMKVAGEVMFTGIVRDITERKEAEKAKEEFVSTVSHELRTPLTSIKGAIGLLTGGAAGDFNQNATKLLHMAQNNSERLLLLINDILDISKLEAEKMEFKFDEISVKALLERSVEQNRGYAHQHDVSYVVDDGSSGATVFVDEFRMMQVMSNLMSNAAKFAPKNDEVIVSATHHHQMIRISVTDHGPGIPKELAPKIFDRFTQADSSDTRQTGGTGLGLYITKAIIEKHNGRINFVSEPGVGTTFYFDIPQLFDVVDSEPSKPPPSMIKRRILICEDEENIASALRLMLAKFGYESDIANNSLEAEQLIKAYDYVAMTLDIMITQNCDHDRFSIFRENQVTTQTPIIFISAKSQLNYDGDIQNSDSDTENGSQPIDEKRFIEDLETRIRDQVPTKRHRILHVEDDSDIRELVSMLLTHEFTVDQAPTLSDAKHRLTEQHYDIILLDIGLPDGSGLELLEIEMGQRQKPEVIIFSAYELKHYQSTKIATNLIKSRTSNEQLVDTVRQVASRIDDYKTC